MSREVRRQLQHLRDGAAAGGGAPSTCLAAADVAGSVMSKVCHLPLVPLVLQYLEYLLDNNYQLTT